MTEQVTNYQCPACTAPLAFSPKTGRLDCEFCDSSFSVEEIEALYAANNSAPIQDDPQWDVSGLEGDWGAEAEDLRAYTCPSCGAQLLCDANTAATACPYCGNPTVVPAQFQGGLRPDYVIPFQLTKEEAIAALKNHYRGKILLPPAFQKQQTIEKIQGVYVPFWLYDCEAEGEFHFNAAQIRTYRQGDYQVTETDHYDVYRSGSMAFEKVPVDASRKMPDDYMDSIEPFDYAALKPFATSYLPGFLADRYDLSPEDCHSRVDARCAQTLEDALRNTVVGFQECTVRSRQVNLHRGKVHYALLPVWMLNVKWEGEGYLFAINGQTGRAVGRLPVSGGRALALFLGLALPLSGLALLVAQLLLG